jgi:peptidoglycan/LPS O-acetylase OafA/YrhL
VKSNRVFGFLLGLATGAAIWLLSPLISGRREPWDSEGVYYPGALLVAGLLGGLLLPDHSRSFAVGIFVGQVLVLLGGVLTDPSSGGLWPLGVVFLALYSLLALLGTALGSGLRRSRNRQNR